MAMLQKGNNSLNLSNYALDEYGILQFNGIIYVQAERDKNKNILQEMHNIPYVGHSSYEKTIEFVSKQYYWIGMKNGVAEYIARCMECEKVKLDN